MKCSVEGCEKPRLTRDYCSSHYHRLRRYGDATYMPPVTDLTGVDRSLYGVWHSMLSRCFNPNVKSYRDYGARGIRVCEGWRYSYRAFVQDLGSRPGLGMTLDRIDNDGNYSCGHCDQCVANGWPANVRWASRLQQAHNSTAVRLLEHAGEALPIAEWTRRRGLGKGTISDRLARGWSVADAIETPMTRAWRYLRNKEVAS